MPHGLTLLNEFLILLLASIPISYICSRLRQSVIVGFIVTGVVIGPYGLRLVHDVEAVDVLAEIGVILLLFSIGLEFSLKRMMEMKRIVLGGGTLQVGMTILITALVFMLIGRAPAQAAYFGFLAALSSTAIVLKTYLDRAEIDTIHGRAGVGILIFQDLCIVPLMLLVPILSGRERSSLANISVKMGTAVAVIVGIIVTARKVVPFLLYHIVRLRSQEIFIIFVVLASFGTAWLTSQFGLSMALGAFIAGVVLSESEYSHQIVSDIMPFRDVFNSIFFISIGMLLSLGFLLTHLPSVLLWFVAIIIGKAIVAATAARFLNYPFRVSIVIGLGLAQVGEFSFIMAKLGTEQGLMSSDDYQRFLAASILSMIATPFMIKNAPRIAFAIQSLTTRRKAVKVEPVEPEAEPCNLGDHVVIIGYGNNGRNLAKVLHRMAIPYEVLELNAESVREGRSNGVSIEYGDSTRREVLNHVGITSARILVVAISDQLATRHTVALAREMNPRLHIIVRTRYMSEVSDLMRLGANQVIPEEFETSIEIFSRVLREYGVTRNIIAREVEAIRGHGYEMLRSASLPLAELDKIAEAFAEISTETIFVNARSSAVGQTLKELDLRGRTGATVTAAVRNGDTEINLGPQFRVAPDDILVLIGKPDQIKRAIDLIDGGIGVTAEALTLQPH
jgi:CPA2 family monovalent cation:H+ antiporter-2